MSVILLLVTSLEPSVIFTQEMMPPFLGSNVYCIVFPLPIGKKNEKTKNKLLKFCQLAGKILCRFLLLIHAAPEG